MFALPPPSRRAPLALAALLAAACSAPEHTNPFDPGTPASSQATASLAGSISLERIGGSAPALSGVAVSVVGSAGSHAAFTDGTGAWVVSGVSPGTYEVRATKDPYEDGVVTGVAVTLDDGGRTLQVSRIALRARRGDIAGHVALKLPNGLEETVGGTLVSVAGIPGAVATDVAGNFLVAGVPAGVQSLTVTRDGYSGTATGVLVEADTVVSTGVIDVYTNPGWISGNVEVSRAPTAYGVTVRARGTTLAGTPWEQTLTTPDSGAFLLSGLPAGSYWVSYQVTNHDVVGAPASVEAGVVTTVADVLLPVSRASIAGTVSLDVSTVPGFAALTDLSGTVVTLLDGAGQVAATVTGTDGGYAFQDVLAVAAAPGGYTVAAQRPDFTAAWRTSILPAAGVTLGAQDLSIQLRPGLLRGGVELWDNDHGAGVNASSAGATVSIAGTAFNGTRWAPPSTTTASTGAWSATPLPPGSYDVTVTSSGRTCGAYVVSVVQPGPDPSVAGTVRCTDAIAPSVVGVGPPIAPPGGVSGYTRTTAVAIPIITQATDGTIPPNLRGYQWSVGASPSFGTAVQLEYDPTPPASITATGLAVGVTNTIWVRAVDWAGNPGPAVSVQVVQDQTPPPSPTVSTPRTSVNDTTASVTLTGSEGDAGFLRYEACWAASSATGSCVASPSCTPATIAQTFPLPLAPNQRTCVWARAVDRAGNASGYGVLSVVSDLTPPTEPVIAPAYDAGTLTIRADSVDFEVVTASTDAPAGGVTPWKGVAWLEVDSGAGFDPLCPATACHPNDTYAPCAAACACTDPRLVCDPDAARFRGVRVPVRAGTTNNFAVRAVDAAGNAGSAASQYVPAEGVGELVAATAYDETAPRLRGTVLVWNQSGIGRQVLDLGGNLRRDDADGTPSSLGYGIADVLSQNAVAFTSGQYVKLRRRPPGGAWDPSLDTTLRTVPPGFSVSQVSANADRVAWAETNGSYPYTYRVYVREAAPGKTLGDGADPTTLVTTFGPASPAWIQVAGNNLLVCIYDVTPWCQLVRAGASGFSGGVSYVPLPAAHVAAISGDGRTLVQGWQGYSTATLTVNQAGPNGTLFDGDDVVATRSYPYWTTAWYDTPAWRIAVDGPHVVGIDGDYTKAGYVTDWFAGTDGVFEPATTTTADDSFVRMLPSSTARPALALADGMLMYQNGQSGSDILSTDLTQVRWLAAGATPYRRPITNGSGVVLYTTPTGSAYLARHRDGTTSSGTLPNAGAYQWYGAWGSSLFSCDRTTVQVQPAKAGRWFVSGMAPPTTVYSAAAYKIEAFAAGEGKAIVADDTTGAFVPIVIQSASGDPALATTANVLAGTGVYSLDSSMYGAAVAVSDRYAFFSCSRTAPPGNSKYFCVRDAGTDRVFNTGGDSGTTKVLVHAPDAGGALPGADVYAMSAKAAGQRVAIRSSSTLYVIDAGRNGVFGDSDDTERVLALGYADDRSYAIAGDWFAYLDNGAPAGLQVFLMNLQTGAVRQLTSHYSTKGDVAVEPTGRVVWRDDVFSSSAIFERTP